MAATDCKAAMGAMSPLLAGPDPLPPFVPPLPSGCYRQKNGHNRSDEFDGCRGSLFSCMSFEFGSRIHMSCSSVA